MNLLCHAIGVGYSNILAFVIVDMIGLASNVVADSPLRRLFGFVAVSGGTMFSIIGYMSTLWTTCKLFWDIAIPGCPTLLVQGILLGSIYANVPILGWVTDEIDRQKGSIKVTQPEIESCDELIPLHGDRYGEHLQT